MVEDLDARIGAVPAATETLAELVAAGREAGTRTLLVDLRRNAGGNSSLVGIVLFFLHGRDGLVEADWGYQVPRYSDLYFENYSRSPEERRRLEAPLAPGGYDFSEEEAWRRSGRAASTDEERTRRLEETLESAGRMPTFERAFRSAGGGAPLWRPRILVLTSARTWSAGYELAGAVVVMQRSSSDLRLDPHLHAVFLDGVYVMGPESVPVFHALSHLSISDVADVLQIARARVVRLLQRRGVLSAQGRGHGGRRGARPSRACARATRGRGGFWAAARRPRGRSKRCSTRS